MVDGLPANVGIGIVPLFCLSSPVKKVPVACETDILVLFVVRKTEFLEDDLWVNHTQEIDFQKRFPVIPMQAFVAAQHGTRTWNHCRQTGNERQSPTLI